MKPETQSKTADASIVIVVDDDASVRKALENLITSVGLKAQTFASTQEFMAWPLPDVAACLVLDVRMPGTNGLEFYRDTLRPMSDIPVIFITAHGDIPMSVRAMKAGAMEFLPKPFREEELLAAIHSGLEKSRTQRAQRSAVASLDARYQALSQREKDVMGLVVQGLLTKQIAAKFGVSEITIKVCRAGLMKKMEAASLAELVRMSERLNLSPMRQ
jgi:FixJ family two-component response regulator